MNNRFSAWALCGLLIVALAGCKDREPPPPAPAVAAADRWLGKWNGPEGTFLQLAGGNGKYEVTIQNLDGPRTFQATAVGDRFEFERDGVRESVRASGGAETGMKWLSEKKDCLTVKAGEGYCRD